MRSARGDVLAEEVPVEINGCVDILHGRVGAGAETPAPHLVAHRTSTEVSPLMTAPEIAARSHARRRLAMAVVVGIAGVAVALAAVYGIGALKRNAADAACAGAAHPRERLEPLARGGEAAFTASQVWR